VGKGKYDYSENTSTLTFLQEEYNGSAYSDTRAYKYDFVNNKTLRIGGLTYFKE
jgi:hypothetical protein